MAQKLHKYEDKRWKNGGGGSEGGIGNHNRFFYVALLHYLPLILFSALDASLSNENEEKNNDQSPALIG